MTCSSFGQKVVTTGNRMIRVQRRLWLEKKGESAMQENNFKKKVREAYLSCLMEELAHARRGQMCIRDRLKEDCRKEEAIG